MVMKEGKTKAQWVTFFSGVGLLVVFAVMSSQITQRTGHGPGLRTRTNAVAFDSAVRQFELEYERLPDVGSSAFDSDDAEGRLLAQILLGKEEEEGKAQNPRKIPFLCIETARSPGKGGLLYGKESEVLGIYDEWGQPFQILLRKPGERGITLVHRGKTVMLERPVVVFSKGKDRIAGTEDDVRMWK